MKEEKILKVKYDLYVFVDDRGEEQKLERFICPRCGCAINKKKYYTDTCPMCYQCLDWDNI